MNGQGSALGSVSILASLVWLVGCGSTDVRAEEGVDPTGDPELVATSDAIFEHSVVTAAFWP